MENYEYKTPPGYGDTFFVYAFDGDALTPGSSPQNLKLQINDGDFVARWWRGVDQLGNISQGIQIRDALQNAYFFAPVNPAQTLNNILNPYMNTGWPIMPENIYPDSGYIGFDLFKALPNAAQVGQLAFHGVRRRKGFRNDPQPSLFPFYEKPFQIQSSFIVPAGWSSSKGGFLVTVPIPDYDFELRRIDGVGSVFNSFTQTDESGDVVLHLVAAIPSNSIGIFLPTVVGTANLPLVITVVGTTINIQLATNGAGNVSTTYGVLVAALLANPAVTALLSVITTTMPNLLAVDIQFANLNLLTGGFTGSYAGLDPGVFKILLTDTNQINISNIPLLFSNLVHVPQTAPNLTSSGHSLSVPENFWPTPPMLYRVNSSIRFYIYVTTPPPGLTAPVLWDFAFSGIRRYPCK